MVFEKTLTDVVRGIRLSKRDTALYISSCIADIKREINSTDISVKANALQKLTFLQMMGYNMSWASFASIEVMSSPRFANKRVGYLSASQGFTQDTEVILLTTNLFQKELRGAVGAGMTGVFEAGLAVNCLSNIVTEDLARELLPELTNLTAHPQPYLRKKAVLCLFKLFVKYPQGLRLTFAQVQKCLDDSNQSVVSCAVNVVTELSDKNPRNYLPLAPAFFGLLTSSSNNWMLIKVVKLLGSLVPEEPRLARKLLEPLASIVRETQAKSLLYEAVYTITLCLPYCRKADGSMPPSVPQIITLCAENLRSFVQESDQNLKYLGLVGFGTLMSSQPRVLSAPEHRPLILACLSDEDVTIRTRALDLLPGMANRKNLMELVAQLLNHVDLAAGTYKSNLVGKIITICSADRYALLQDFAWYIDVLVQLGRTRGIERHGALIGDQAVNVALRVLPVRTYAVRRMAGLLLAEGRKARSRSGWNRKEANRKNNDRCEATGNGDDHVMPEMLPAAAWVVGEYSHLIADAMSLSCDGENGEPANFDSASEGSYHSIIQALTAPSNVDFIDTSAQASYVQAAPKVLAAAAGQSPELCSDRELEECVLTLQMYLPLYFESTNCEVQERAFTLYHLLDGLGLIERAAVGGTPNLVRAEGEKEDSDESTSSSDEEARKAPPPAQGDLLGLIMSASPNASPEPLPLRSDPIAPSRASTDDTVKGFNSLASRCRASAETLQYLLTPEPMKPVSGKAQKKKWHSPPASLKVDLDAPPDISVFASLLDGEMAQRPGKGTIEAISFTQQGRGGGSMAPGDAESGTGETDIDFSNLDGMGGSFAAANSSFQHSGGVVPRPSGGGQPPGRAVDPFYLNSNMSVADKNTAMIDARDGMSGGVQQQHEASQSSRFGTIQLLDSGDEDSGEDRKQGRQRRKKDKKHKKKKDNFGMGHSDLALFSSKEMMLPHVAATSVVAGGITVYGSDEEDEKDGLPISTASYAKMKQKKGTHMKEFEKLARVDLTAPLREDEVMPRNEHRVVSTRPSSPTASAIEEERHKKKKKKKNREKSSKKHKADKKKQYGLQTASQSGADGDLLNLGGLLNVGSFTNDKGGAAAVVATEPSSDLSHNLISSAFDDLLNLEPAPTLTMGTTDTSLQLQASVGKNLPEDSLLSFSHPQTSTKTSQSAKGKKLWQRGSIKVSHVSQTHLITSGRPLDWSLIELHFKTVLCGNDNSEPPAATLSLKIINNMPEEILQNVNLTLDKEEAGAVVLGDVKPGAVVESPVHAGPFPYGADGSVPEVRGIILASGWSLPFKVVMPSTPYLNPMAGLTQDWVLDELSSGRQYWVSYSVRLIIEAKTNIKKVKGRITSFLKADEVTGSGGDDLSGTVAAEAFPRIGVKVLALIKVKKGIAKVDLKCTDAKLGKALVSDLKKLIL